MRFLLVLLFSLGACRSAPQATATPASPVLVRLTKSPCNAKCPAWEAEVTRAGELRFVGLAHTRTEGAAASSLDEATLAALVARLEAVDVTGWPTKAAPLADAQLVSLTLKGLTYRYAVGGDAPEPLAAFVAELEQRLGLAQWVTGAAER